MKHFLLRLNPPRPTFAYDMSDEEKAVMQRHGAYLSGLAEKGKVLMFGPVADPKGPWGVGIIRVETDEEAKVLADQDPAVTSNIGLHYEVLPMLQLVTGKI